MFDKKFITQAIDRSAQSPLDRRRFFSAAGIAGLGVGAAALIPATGAQAADAQAEADAGQATDLAVLNSRSTSSTSRPSSTCVPPPATASSRTTSPVSARPAA